MEISISSALYITGLQQQQQQPQRERCTKCKKVFNEVQHYKMCAPCREKNRIKSRLSKQRKEERDAEYMRRLSGHGELSSDAIVDENDRRGAGIPNTVTAAAKRKTPKAVDEMEGEERRMALGMMNNGLKQVVKGNKRVVAPVRMTSSDGEGKEYQTATALYENLKKTVSKINANKCLQFHGFHAIIANPTIDNHKRVELVTKDLRKIARVPFDHYNPTKLCDWKTMGRVATYTCRCLGNEVVPGPPVSESSKTAMKGTQGDLIGQARLARMVEASAVTVPRICGGIVKITAVDDGRHPLGILAQRISISIDHPSASSKFK